MKTTGTPSKELSAAPQALSDIWDERSNLSRSESVKTTQVQGVHHITIVGSTKQSAVDFWQGVLGMPFLFEQPNLGKPDENHLYFDPGDGRLLTVFTDESRQDAGRKAPREPGCVETSRVQCFTRDFRAGSGSIARAWYRIHTAGSRIYG